LLAAYVQELEAQGYVELAGENHAPLSFIGLSARRNHEEKSAKVYGMVAALHRP
jgi:hypothetical protein